MSDELTFFQKVLRLPLWPFRHWRITIPGVLVLVFGVVVYQRIETGKTQDGYAESGIAGTFADLELRTIPAAENAAADYAAIANSVVGTELTGRQFGEMTDRFFHQVRAKQQSGFLSKLNEESEPLTESELEILKKYVDDNEAAYDAIEIALDLEGCQFLNYKTLFTSGAPYTGMEMNPLINGVPHVREAARLARAKSMWAYHNGELEEAIQWNRNGLRIANQLTSDPLLISGLDRIGIAEMMVSDIPLLLSLENQDIDLWNETLKELESLADRAVSSIFLRGEICFMNDGSRAMRMGGFLNELLVSGPGESLVLDEYVPLIQSMEDTSIWFYEFYQRWANDIKNRGRSYIPGKMMAQILGPALVRHLEATDGQHARAQQAILGITLRHYKNEHGGYPEKLAELVPDYLGAPLNDPFSNTSYVYRKNGEGYVLYSLWVDGNDDGGAPRSRRTGDLVWQMGN